jgi:hypothetical protein
VTNVPSPDVRVELKYVIDETQVQNIKQWARERLGVDPHCCQALVDSYDVHTLYLDTQQLDLFHRSGVAGITKHRIRRYGNDETLWLECKRKRQSIVRKNRMAVAEREVWNHLVVGSASTAEHWCGAWFRERVARRSLGPTIDVHYRRFARMACMDGQSVRLTIDSHLEATPVAAWEGSAILDRSLSAERRRLAPVSILELKFNNHLPHIFKELLREFALSTGSFSKYRTAVANCQAANQPEDSSDIASANRSLESGPSYGTGLGVVANA